MCGCLMAMTTSTSLVQWGVDDEDDDDCHFINIPIWCMRLLLKNMHCFLIFGAFLIAH